jgi:transcriptional regulator with XRE-family HTH domain
MHIGISIRKIRKEKFPELTQTEFARRAGIAQTYLSQIEGGSKTPTITVLERISKEFEIPLPIIFWYSMEYKDIAENKKQLYDILKPTVDAIINNFF